MQIFQKVLMSEAISYISDESPQDGAPGDRRLSLVEPGYAPGFFDSADFSQEAMIERLQDPTYAAYIDSKELTDTDLSLMENLACRNVDAEKFSLLNKSFQEAIQPIQGGRAASSMEAQKSRLARRGFYQLMGMLDESHPMAIRLYAISRKGKQGTYPSPYNLIKTGRMFAGLDVDPLEAISKDADLIVTNIEPAAAAGCLRALQKVGISIKEKPSLIKYDGRTILDGEAEITGQLSDLRLPIAARDVIISRPEVLQGPSQKMQLLVELVKQYGDFRAWVRQASGSTLGLHKKLLADIVRASYIPLESHVATVAKLGELNINAARQFTKKYATRVRRENVIEILQAPDAKRTIGKEILRMYLDYAPLTDAEVAAYPRLAVNSKNTGEVLTTAGSVHEMHKMNERPIEQDEWLKLLASPTPDAGQLIAALAKGSRELKDLSAEEAELVKQNRKEFFTLLGWFNPKHLMYEPFQAFAVNTNNRLVSPMKVVRLARMLAPHFGEDLSAYFGAADCGLLYLSEQTVEERLNKLLSADGSITRWQTPYNFARGIDKFAAKPTVRPSPTAPKEVIVTALQLPQKKVAPTPVQSRTALMPKVAEVHTPNSSIVAAALRADSVGQYLREIKKSPLLDAEGEEKLAKRIEAGLFAAHKLEAAQANGEVLGMQFRHDLQQIVREGEKANKKLVEANLPLVVDIANRFKGRGVAFLDLIQEGNLKLIETAQKYDYAKGFKFSTYAYEQIQGAIKDAIANQARTARIPKHKVETINKLRRVQNDLYGNLGRKPTLEELATEMDMTSKKLLELREYAHMPVSLDEAIDDDGKLSLQDVIADGDTDDHALNSVLFGDMQHELRQVIATLPELQARAIDLRFGLTDGKARTFDEIAKVMGIGNTGAQYYVSCALKKMRHPSRSDHLRDFLED